MFFLILLGALALFAVVATVVQVHRDGYAPVAVRPGTLSAPRAGRPSRSVGGAD